MKLFGLSLIASLAAASPMKAMTPEPRAWGFCDNPGRLIALSIDAHGQIAEEDPDNIRKYGGYKFLDFLTALNETTDISKADKVSVIAYKEWSETFVGDPNADDSARNLITRMGAEGFSELRYAFGVADRELEKMGSDQDRRGLVMIGASFAENQGWVADEVNNLKNKGIRINYAQLTVHDDRRVKGIDPGVANAIRETGGIAMEIKNKEDMDKFFHDATTNGLTHNDNKCKRTDIPKSGGPLGNDIHNVGQCISDNEAVYTYKPTSEDRNLVENLEYNIELVSTERPTVIVATFINKVTGQTSSVTISKRNPFGRLTGQVRPPEEIEVRVKVTGADQNDCQYKINSNIKPTNPKPSTSSQAPPPPSSSAPPPTSSSNPPPTSSSNPPPTSSSNPPPTSSSNPPPSSSATLSTSSSTQPTPSASSACPTNATSTVIQTSTIVSTVTQTATGNATQTVTVTQSASSSPTPTGDNCICKCKCDQKGAQPMPRFEL